MSHFSRLNTKFVELDYLMQALDDLGYTAEAGDLTIRGFGGQNTKVDVKVSVRLSNDIGFRKNGDTYQIIADWWGVLGVKQKEFADKVAQRYAYHATRAQLEKQGFALVEESTEKGQVRMVLRRLA